MIGRLCLAVRSGFSWIYTRIMTHQGTCNGYMEGLCDVQSFKVNMSALHAKFSSLVVGPANTSFWFMTELSERLVLHLENNSHLAWT